MGPPVVERAAACGQPSPAALQELAEEFDDDEGRPARPNHVTPPDRLAAKSGLRCLADHLPFNGASGHAAGLAKALAHRAPHSNDD